MSHSADTRRPWTNGVGRATAVVGGAGCRPQVLVPPGEYVAVISRIEGPVMMFGRRVVFVSCVIEGAALVTGERDPACAEYYVDPDGHEMFRAYNVQVVNGEVVVGGGSNLAREWSRVTGLQCPADGRVDLQLLVGRIVRVRVTTVDVDRDRDPLPPQARYSKAAKILELPA